MALLVYSIGVKSYVGDDATERDISDIHSQMIHQTQMKSFPIRVSVDSYIFYCRGWIQRI